MNQKEMTPLAELHAHLGSSVDPAILWSIAHQQGIKLPTKDYWEFDSLITMSGDRKNKNLNDMHFNFFHWTELIQSSTEAVEESVKSVIGGGYRKCNLVLQELRFNPMFRNRSGERDLDYIIKSALWGLDRALLEYPQVKGGIILMMDRMLNFKQNEIIVHKAIKYKSFGIIGIDVAGPERKTFSMKKHASLFKQAKDAGLGVTVHTGEAGSLEELKFVVREIEPDRIGHGIRAVEDPKLLAEIVEKNITLEVCPTSNLRNSVVKDLKALKRIFDQLLKFKVKFTINTDGPEMYRTSIKQEREFLVKNGILTQKQVDLCNDWAFEATFVR